MKFGTKFSLQNNLIVVLTIGWCLCAGGVPAETSSLDKIRELMGNLAMRIDHKEEIKPAEGSKAPFKSERWIFECGVAKRQINYSRYVSAPSQDENQPSPSLINSDMGIGLDLDAFGNWYRGNVIRVMIDRKDIMAQKAAAKVESKSDQQGYLRFTWELQEGTRMVLSFVVPEDGHAVYARVDMVSPGAANLFGGSLDIHLTGYPGGFGPAYKLPSHRTVKTAKNQGEVPYGWTDDEFPVIPITQGEHWAFYADALSPTGSLGLVFVPSEVIDGEVQMSNYGLGTTLHYPSGTTSCKLAFFAYDVEREAAFRDFSRTVDRELTALKTMRFWPEEK